MDFSIFSGTDVEVVKILMSYFLSPSRVFHPLLVSFKRSAHHLSVEEEEREVGA